MEYRCPTLDKTNTSSISSESIPVSERSVTLKKQTVSNIASTVSVQTMTSITANTTKREESSHELKGKQPIRPKCFSSANGTSFSASPNADLSVNSHGPPPVVTLSTPPMQNALHALTQRNYGTNGFFRSAHSLMLSILVFISNLHGSGPGARGFFLPRNN